MAHGGPRLHAAGGLLCAGERGTVEGVMITITVKYTPLEYAALLRMAGSLQEGIIIHCREASTWKAAWENMSSRDALRLIYLLGTDNITVEWYKKLRSEYIHKLRLIQSEQTVFDALPVDFQQIITNDESIQPLDGAAIVYWAVATLPTSWEAADALWQIDMCIDDLAQGKSDYGHRRVLREMWKRKKVFMDCEIIYECP